MKAFAKILPVLALACTYSLAYGQSAVTMEEGHMPKKGKRLEPRGMEDCVMMKGGKMMTVKDGKKMPMATAMTMNNGTKVMPDGTVMMAGGKSMMLKDGQCVMMDGRVMDDKMMKGNMKGHKMSSM